MLNDLGTFGNSNVEIMISGMNLRNQGETNVMFKCRMKKERGPFYIFVSDFKYFLYYYLIYYLIYYLTII